MYSDLSDFILLSSKAGGKVITNVPPGGKNIVAHILRCGAAESVVDYLDRLCRNFLNLGNDITCGE